MWIALFTFAVMAAIAFAVAAILLQSESSSASRERQVRRPVKRSQ